MVKKKEGNINTAIWGERKQLVGEGGCKVGWGQTGRVIINTSEVEGHCRHT